jgi:ribosomal protein S18 acetylase RimI-like enzyme
VIEGSWRRATVADIASLSSFLSEREERCAGFSGRLLSGGEMRLPARGSVWIWRRGEADPDPGGVEGGALAGALLCHPTRLAFPLLAEAPDRGAGLGGELSRRPWKPRSAIGSAVDLDLMEVSWGLEPLVKVAYRLMAFRGLSPGGAAARIRGTELPPGLTVRPALPTDLDELFALQEAYEREEVLTVLHRFDPAGCRASLGSALESQLIFVAVEGMSIVAKAATNARGFGVDQIGGVFTKPERRGRGIGGAVVSALVETILATGRRAVLFVKPTNPPAFGLYKRLGFEEVCDYRADYF